jgi:O-antigen ligase
MLAVILGVIAFLRAKWLLVVGAVVGIVVIVTVPRIQTRIQGAINPDASASLRVVSWQNSLSIAQTHPWLGVGFNSYRYAQDRYGIVVLGENVNAGAGADSSWLFIFATTGVLGLTIFCLFYFTLIWESWQAFILAGTELERSIGLASLAVLCGLVPASQFNNALFYTWILRWWMALIGLMLGVKYVTHLGTRTD